MGIIRNECLTWAAEDYIYKNMYSYDQQSIKKNELQIFVDYYFNYIDPFADFVEVDIFTDWLHDLTEEEQQEIREGA